MTFVTYLPKISVDYMLVSIELKAKEGGGEGRNFGDSGNWKSMKQIFLVIIKFYRLNVFYTPFFV